MRHALLILLAACGGSSDDSHAPATGTTPVNPFATHPILAAPFLNVAHRGGSLLRPEETIEALQHALVVGAGMLEVDVWSTSDGELVLMHDDAVDRTTDGTGSIRSMSLAEVQALDAGYWFTTDGVTYPYRGQGYRVPRLADALAAVPGQIWSIEIKQQDPPIVDPLLAVIDDAGMAGSVVIGSFYDPAVADVRAKRPEILTAMGTQEGLSFFYAEEAEYEPQSWYLAAPTSLGDIVLDQATIEKAHRFGITVHVWTVNDPAEMQTIKGWGADGIITDDPEALAALAR